MTRIYKRIGWTQNDLFIERIARAPAPKVECTVAAIARWHSICEKVSIEEATIWARKALAA